MTKEQVLKQYFGYDHFRPLQAEIIDWILAGNDALVLMPTGGGKSVCFQVPAMVMDGLTLVISPLIALMQDQVQNLKAIGIPAEFVNSSQSGSQQSDIERRCRMGNIKILYISPEKLLSPNYLDFIRNINVSLFAIDESHCVSFWGHDFRPEYTKLNILKEQFPNIPIIALTATADKVTRKDIITQLNVPDAQTFISSFDRPNLSLEVLPGRNRLKVIIDFVSKRPNQSGIIYCLSRNSTEDVAARLQSLGIKAKHYHAGMDTAYRAKVQTEFIKDDIQVIVATIAFGMGIDKSNVRWIIHYNLPNNVESYYQELGRAGRDGQPSDTLLFYTYADVMARQRMLDDSGLVPEMKELQEAKLNRMKQFAEAEICRRRILLSYFNENVEKDCGNCDVCRNPPQRFDGTVIAQKALSAVARTGEKVAMTLLIDVLRGSNNRNVISRGFHELKTFGVGKEIKAEEWADYLMQMLNSGVMDIAYDEGHAFKLNNASWQVLKEGKSVKFVRFEPYEVKRARQAVEVRPEKSKQEIIKDALFERLRALRKTIADAKDIPPFIVFSDATLSDMAQKKPISKLQMLNVSGVGEQKYAQFGEVFIQEIMAFARENNEPNKTRAMTGMTYLETLDLYKTGKTPAEIAKQRGMTESTIVGHLAKMYEEGHPIDLERIITKIEIDRIIAAAKAIKYEKGTAIKPLFEAMDGTFDYHKIRLALLASRDY